MKPNRVYSIQLTVILVIVVSSTKDANVNHFTDNISGLEEKRTGSGFITCTKMMLALLQSQSRNVFMLNLTEYCPDPFTQTLADKVQIKSA